MKNYLLTCVLLLTLVSGYTQCDDTRMFIFGHSLLDHRPPATPTPSDETTVPHWLHLLHQAAGTSFAAGGQYGFLPQHANVPPFSQWGYDLVAPVWESDTETFAEANINTVIVTAGNFMQWQAPDLDYPTDPGVTPISATETIVDWLNAQTPGIRIYIYENWPDMAPFANDAFPPTSEGLADYYTYTSGEWHQWWLNYQDAVLASRPEAAIRMIPVGPILSGLFTTQLAGQIPVTELYEDNAPHGRASLYFLAALISYSATCQTPPPASFAVPEIVHPAIRTQYSAISDYIWQALNEFTDAQGSSRVFFGITDTRSPESDIEALRIVPNPTSDIVQVRGASGPLAVSVFDGFGRRLAQRIFQAGQGTIDLQAYPRGWYLVRTEDEQGKVQGIRVLKQ